MCRLLADLRPPLISRRFPPLLRLLPAATPRPPVFRLIPPRASMLPLASMGRPLFTPLSPLVPRRVSLPVPLRVPFSVSLPVPRLRPLPPVRRRGPARCLRPPIVPPGYLPGFVTASGHWVPTGCRSRCARTNTSRAGAMPSRGKVITSCWAMPRFTATEPCAMRWTTAAAR